MTPNVTQSAPLQRAGCSGEQERSQLLLVPDPGGGEAGRASGAAPQLSGGAWAIAGLPPACTLSLPPWPQPGGDRPAQALLCSLARSSVSGELCPRQVAVESAGVAMKRGTQSCSDLRSRWTLTAKGACKETFIIFPEERDVENEAGGEN